jgi:hypothetical protein
MEAEARMPNAVFCCEEDCIIGHRLLYFRLLIGLVQRPRLLLLERLYQRRKLKNLAFRKEWIRQNPPILLIVAEEKSDDILLISVLSRIG